MDTSVVALLVLYAITRPGDYHCVITGDSDILPAIKITVIAKRYNPRAHKRPTYFPTSPKTITDTAEQGISVTRTAVINLSRFDSIIRHERHPGTLQPNPIIKETQAFP